MKYLLPPSMHSTQNAGTQTSWLSIHIKQHIPNPHYRKNNIYMYTTALTNIQYLTLNLRSAVQYLVGFSSCQNRCSWCTSCCLGVVASGWGGQGVWFQLYTLSYKGQNVCGWVWLLSGRRCVVGLGLALVDTGVAPLVGTGVGPLVGTGLGHRSWIIGWH